MRRQDEVLSKSASLVFLDGTYGEGGGALVRSALVMSALTQQAVHIHDVRGASRFPGLDAEDVSLLRVLGQICGADTSRSAAGDSNVEFHPTHRPIALNGAVPIVRSESGRGPNALVILLALLPLLSRSGAYSTVIAEGETYGANAIGFDSFSRLTLPVLQCFGFFGFATLDESGFGRESKGRVSLDVEPSALHGKNWDKPGKLIELEAIVVTAQIPKAVGARGVAHLRSLCRTAQLPIAVEHREVPSSSPGCHVTVCARCEHGFGGGSAMGARGTPIEALSQQAFQEAHSWLKSETNFDPYIADQVLIPAVFADGPTSFRVSRLSQRLLTTVWVVKQFVPIHLTVRGTENHAGSISIRH